MNGMRWVWGIGVVGFALLGALAPLDARLVERWYSTGIYPFIQRTITPVSNLFPFALLDVLVLAVVVTVIVVLIKAFRVSRRKKTWKPFLGALARLVQLGAAVYLVFLLVWGLNYRRVSMADRL